MVKGQPVQLARTLAYALGRRPDEFGLVTDSNGFVRIKDLLKAFSEEKGLRHIRQGHLREVLLTAPTPPVEMDGNMIRAVDRAHLPRHIPAQTLPKLMYTCVRRKTYPVALESGLAGTFFPMVVLAADADMALRIGRRRDASPVLITVQVSQAREAGVRFLSAGETLYLAAEIPPGCFSGPPLPRVKEMTPPAETRPRPEPPLTPGSFFPDLSERVPDSPSEKRDRRGTRPEWKRERKRMQRMERKKGAQF